MQLFDNTGIQNETIDLDDNQTEFVASIGFEKPVLIAMIGLYEAI
ncbi:hypothetical protein ACWOA4_02100 [Pediococcus pentosaceus]|nr:hypothetical protein [Pediococcus pentosaceus]